MSNSRLLRPKLVPVHPPQLIGQRGGLYYLDNKLTPAPGRGHFAFRLRRTPPSPLFSASPSINWQPAKASQATLLWGAASTTARAAVINLVHTTARKLSICVVDDDQVKQCTDTVALRPPVNALHVRDINFIAGQIVAAARHFHEWSLAWAEELKVPRASGKAIEVTWQTYGTRTTRRLRRLLRAAERGTRARIELQWFQAPAAARYFIYRAAMEWPCADRRAFEAHGIGPGDMISAPIPSREFLRRILPEAIKLSAQKRGRRVHDADVFLAVVRESFLMIVGDGNDRLRVAHLEVPNGAGADFVREIEEIFGLRLLDEASLHAVKRVRGLKLPTAMAAGPYKRLSVRIL